MTSIMTSAAARELCFVAMPSGTKYDAAGPVDFDTVYEQIIAPAIDAAGLESVRAGGEVSGQYFILCRFAIADLTTANANLFYELGIRHAARPGSTILLYAEDRGPLPFDVASLPALPYRLDSSGTPADVDAAVAALARRLERLREESGAQDRPISEVLDSDVARLKTDTFRERSHHSQGIKEKLTAARRSGLAAVTAVENEMPALDGMESAAIVDLLLSYRAVKGWTQMIALVERMPKPLAATLLVREQLALALNRAGDDVRAEDELLELLKRHGPSSETLSLLGRVYKDRWDRALKANDKTRAAAVLDQAIDAYRRGFEADWRDAFPGINAITLMALREPPDAAKDELLPVVRYAVLRRLAGTTPDYWDYASMVELAIHANDHAAAMQWLAKAVAVMRETWEGESTANNLRLIAEAREARGEDATTIREVIAKLAPGA